MFNMKNIGWNAFFEDQFQPYKEQGLCVGRVLKEVRHQYRIYTQQGIVDGDVSGHFQYTAISRSDYPTVGDWVVVRPHDDFAQVEKVLTRATTFSRNRAGSEVQEQVIAANIDFLCIVCGLDGGRNFNLRGIERYIAMTMEGGAQPVVVLNKSDLCADEELALLQAQSVAEAFPIHLVSAATHEGLEAFATSFESGATIAFTGHSGVGKSSLINSLLGRAELKTGALRESDLRGRHTTSHKELFFLESGAMVIDTPGMRELQLWGSSQGLDGTYSEIQEAAKRCRFNDCTHQNEPGCAVRELLIDGSLEMERYENYLDMRSELTYLASKVNGKKSYERRAQEKAFSKLVRQSQKKDKRQ